VVAGVWRFKSFGNVTRRLRIVNGIAVQLSPHRLDKLSRPLSAELCGLPPFE